MQKLLTIEDWHIRPEFIVAWRDNGRNGIEVSLTNGKIIPIPGINSEEFGKAFQRVLRHNAEDLDISKESYDFGEYEC